MTDRFEQHQARIATTLGCINDVLRSDRPDIFRFAQLRWQLIREVRDYQLFKHHQIFDPAAKSTGPEAIRAAALKAQCIGFGERVMAHIMAWSGRDVLTEWKVFAPTARSLTRTLELRMRADRTDCARLWKA